MDAVLASIQDKWMAYVAVILCSAPLLYIFRRRVVPIVWYTGEMVAYMAIFHLLLHGIVRLARWFKLESTFMTDKVDVGWDTPLFTFWDRGVYKPTWLFYFELVAAILIVVGVVRLRPFTAQKTGMRKPVQTKGMAGMVRPPAANRSGVRK
jgi:hypothetical protein